MAWGSEALYANPNDCDAFGHAICQILQYPNVADRLAKYGSQKARSKFTWSGVAQQILSVFQQVQDWNRPVDAVAEPELPARSLLV